MGRGIGLLTHRASCTACDRDDLPVFPLPYVDDFGDPSCLCEHCIRTGWEVYQRHKRWRIHGILGFTDRVKSTENLKMYRILRARVEGQATLEVSSLGGGDLGRRARLSGQWPRRREDHDDSQVKEPGDSGILVHQVRVLEGGRLRPGSLVLVRYLDHLAFRWAKPDGYGPCIRETVGWVLEDNDRYLKLLWDKGELPEERPDLASGLVILKQDILEVKILELG